MSRRKGWHRSTVHNTESKRLWTAVHGRYFTFLKGFLFFGNSVYFLALYFLLCLKRGKGVIPMAYARAQTIMLLSCKKVCFWFQVREKGRKEVAEWCLVSNRQVCNWCHKDTNISVSNLFNLADLLNCRPEDLVTSHPMPEGRE